MIWGVVILAFGCCCSILLGMSEKRRLACGLPSLAEAYHRATQPLAHAVVVHGDDECSGDESDGEGGGAGRTLRRFGCADDESDGEGGVKPIPVAVAAPGPAEGIPVPHGHREVYLADEDVASEAESSLSATLGAQLGYGSLGDALTGGRAAADDVHRDDRALEDDRSIV